MRVAHIIWECDMRCQHEGLESVARSAKIKLDLLAPGDMCIFLNRRLTKVKVYVLGGVVSYYRAPDGSKLNDDRAHPL